MKRIALTLAVLLSVAALAAGQEPPRTSHGQGQPIRKPKNKVKMDTPEERPGADKKDGEKAAEKPKEPRDPFERALAGLATWPSPAAREAASALVLLGTGVEDKLIAALADAPPGLAAGICHVLGQMGGDQALKALYATADRPSMVEHLDTVFTAIGNLEGLNAGTKILPYLANPRRPARDAAEHWLRKHLDASLCDPLVKMLKSSTRSARLSAFRLLVAADQKRAASEAVGLLGDPIPEVARAAADLLASTADADGIARLNDLVVKSTDDRSAAYAAVALASVMDRTARLPYSPATIDALLGRRGILSHEKLNRGVGAIVLADVGFASVNEKVEALLDRQIVDLLLDTFGGQTYYNDFSAIAELARDRFGKLTGILDRRSVPELWSWWSENREGFTARRTLLELDPDTMKEFRIRARSLTEPALTDSIFSNRAADASDPDALGVDFVYLLSGDAHDLAVAVEQKLLPLPDSGTVDPFRTAPDRAPGSVGPDVAITISVNRRTRTLAGRQGSLAPEIAEFLARLGALKKKYAWERYWDRGTYPRFEDFVKTEAAWFGAEHSPEAVAGHRKELILKSLDDLVTPEARTEAMDALEATGAALTDSDAYALALMLERETEVTPFARRLVRALAGAGRSLVLPILSDWLEKHPGPQTLDLFARALANMGGQQVLTAAATDRAYLVRAAMRAAPDALKGDELLRTLKTGLTEGPEAVRREALTSLGRCGLPGALPLISGVLDDPAEGIRNAAIAALGEMKDPAVVPILTRQVASDDFGRRVAAVTALCRTGLPDALGPVLSSLRRDPSPAVRSVAAREVSRFKTAALPGLTGIVTDLKEKPEIRAGAVDALVRVGGDRVVAVLTALLSDSAPEVADAAAYALASRQEKGAVPRLLEALSAGRDTLQTVAALEQVSCRSFPSARAAELPAIYKGWWGDHRDESAASWFVAALEEKGYDVGDLESLGSADPSPKTVPVLMNVLLDDAWYLRADANLWLDRVTTESFGEVTRFTSPEDVRAVREKWRAWWKAR